MLRWTDADDIGVAENDVHLDVPVRIQGDSDLQLPYVF
jgi:hypothetical protein